MTRDDADKVIKVLNEARSMELHAIHQYMQQHYSLAQKNIGVLAKEMQLIAIDEMRHAESFAERIRELGGTPTSVQAGEITFNQTIEDIYPFDVNEELTTVDKYLAFQRVCSDVHDDISVKLFSAIIHVEKVHKQYFDAQYQHIKNPEEGVQYLTKKYFGTSSSIGVKKGYVQSADELSGEIQ